MFFLFGVKTWTREAHCVQPARWLACYCMVGTGRSQEISHTQVVNCCPINHSSSQTSFRLSYFRLSHMFGLHIYATLDFDSRNHQSVFYTLIPGWRTLPFLEDLITWMWKHEVGFFLVCYLACRMWSWWWWWSWISYSLVCQRICIYLFM